MNQLSITNTRRRIVAWIAATCFVAALVAVSIQYWIAPTLLRRHLQAQASEWWEGTLTVPEIDFHYREPTTMRDLVLRDGRGRRWLEAAVVEIRLDRPVTGRPRLAGLVTRGVYVTLHGAPPAMAHTTAPGTGGRDGSRRLGPLRLEMESEGEGYRGIAALPLRGDLSPLVGEGNVSELADGGVVLTGWRWRVHDHALAEDVKATIRPRPMGPELVVSGAILGGRLDARLGGNASAPDERRGRIEATGLDLAIVAPVLPAAERPSRGIADLDAQLTVDRGMLRSTGRLTLHEVDLRGLSLVRGLADFAGIEDLSPLEKVNVAAVFLSEGPVVTLTEGRMSSDLPEMVVEPGATFDLATGEIDATLALALAERLDVLPLLEPVGNLVRALTRIRIQGRWDDPAEKLFHKGEADKHLTE